MAISATSAMFLTYTDEVYNWGTGEQTRFSFLATVVYGLSNYVIGYFVRVYGSGWVVLGGSMMTLAGMLLLTVSLNDVIFQVRPSPCCVNARRVKGRCEQKRARELTA
eukprot:9199511-Pyramimonas_sp.AAC.1